MAQLKTHCVNGHKYLPDNLRIVRKGKYSYQTCLICERFRSKIRNRRLRAKGVKLGPTPSYMRQYRAEVRMGLRTPQPRQQAHRKVTPEVLDWLQIEGGWWGVEGIATRLDHKPDSVQTSLRRMQKRGLVQSRRIEIRAGNTRVESSTWRVEWKALFLETD